MDVTEITWPRGGVSDPIGVGEALILEVIAWHDRGVVHRELSPLTVRLRDGLPVVRPGTAPLTRKERAEAWDGRAVGQPGWAAPEQARNARGVDERADVFSLGCLLYQLVVGEPPFASAVAAESGIYLPAGERVPSLPKRIDAAIAGALRPDPAERVPDARTLLSMWRGQPVPYRLPTAAPVAPRTRRRRVLDSTMDLSLSPSIGPAPATVPTSHHRWRYAAVLAVLAVVAAGAVIAALVWPEPEASEVEHVEPGRVESRVRVEVPGER